MKYELAREGEMSTDGRFIIKGAITWREPPLPVTDATGKVIGKVTEVWREGDSVWGNLELLMPEAITVDTDLNSYSVDDAQTMVIESACISGGRANTQDKFIWKD